MAAADPFGFEAVAKDEALDLTTFAPKPRPVDRVSAAAATEVAQDAGFTRRKSTRAESALPASPRSETVTVKLPKRRVNLQELLGLEDRYPETERAQVNMLAPVPVVLRWRRMIKETDAPAWELLEKAMDALEGRPAKAGRRGS
jgi:hypothetical protein